MRSLEEASAEAAGCLKCRLAEGRTQVVYGVGNPEAELMFIGEGPGFHEDKQGEPFVGAAGQLLNEMLDGIGLERRDVYIANVVMCRPPGNRDPEQDEIESCTPWLREQVELIDPRVIMTLGRFAGAFMLERKISITRIRGERFTVWGDRTLVPTLHPAAILRSGGRGSRSYGELQDDFETVRDLLGAKPSQTPTPERSGGDSPEAGDHGEEQLGLF